MKRASIVAAVAVGLVIPARAAPGGIDIIAGVLHSTYSPVHFFVQDGAGRRTGQLLDGTSVDEIPGTLGNYGRESVGNDEAGASGDETVRFESSRVPSGDYTLHLLPTASTSYFLHLTIMQANGAFSSSDFSGFAISGTTVVFVFNYDPTAPSPTPVSKTVSFLSLRHGIQVALQLGQLGDAALASRLEKMLVRAETSTAKGQNEQAANHLGQFIRRLESAFKKEPDPNTDDDPNDKKATYPMSRFIILQAKNSLQADARILIVSLGETPKK